MTAVLVVFGLFLLAIGASIFYFVRYEMTRPPLGVMNLWDVGLTVIFIVLIPYWYLLLPSWFNTPFLTLATFGLMVFLLEPVVGRRSVRWLLAALMVTADLAFFYFSPGLLFLAVNNLIIIVTVMAASNAWVQSGARARHIVILAIAIAIYDFIFTARLDVTAELLTQLGQYPFAPQLGWESGESFMAIGMGDTLMATTFVVVMWKAYSKRAALAALLATMVAFGILLIIPVENAIFLTSYLPAMVIIGPVQLLVYLVWSRRAGRERTMVEYWAGRNS
jgi:hypothetical protein